MTALYLYANAALYAIFAIMCTLKYADTAQSLGYTQLTHAGRSEYLVIYGGLQAGLAVFFALAARDPSWRSAGLALALSLYVPIVVFRWITIARFSPVGGLTLGVAALETALLVWGLVVAWAEWR